MMKALQARVIPPNLGGLPGGGGPWEEVRLSRNPQVKQAAEAELECGFQRRPWKRSLFIQELPPVHGQKLSLGRR